MSSNLTLDEIGAHLSRPFDPDLHTWRPLRLNREKTRGEAFVYIPIASYLDRLTRVCGVANWSSEVRVTMIPGHVAVAAKLTVHGKDGTTIKTSTGESGVRGGDNTAVTSAEAQALKRAFEQLLIAQPYVDYLPKDWYPLNERKDGFSRDAIHALRTTTNNFLAPVIRFWDAASENDKDVVATALAVHDLIAANAPLDEWKRTLNALPS